MERSPETLAVDFPEPRLRALDGDGELAVAEAAEADIARPQRVTAIIATLYEAIDDEPCDATLVRRLSIGTRKWLLQHAARRFGSHARWFEAHCSACSAPFDLECDLAHASRTAARAGFPVVEIATSLGPRKFEAPNGGHEECIADMQAADPRRALAGLCGLGAVAQEDASRFTEDDLALIDDALEQLSPDVADGVDAACPECGHRAHFIIDPLDFAFPPARSVLRDVHALAHAFGWSERDILALPVARRRAYVAMVVAQASRATRPVRAA